MGIGVEERFWQKVDKANGENACWEWTAYIGYGGYGRFWIRGKGVIHAHRAAYEILCGPIPEGMFVCHHCDNPSCVNPAHLFLGTEADNVHDMWNKGRGLPPRPRPQDGEGNNRAALSEADVLEIRAMRATTGATYAVIARRFPVGEQAVGKIIRGERWSSVPSGQPDGGSMRLPVQTSHGRGNDG